MEKKTVSFSKDSSNLFFHILTQCNLHCTHCYINKKQHGDEILSIDTIKSWLSLFGSKARSTHLVFLGGEPTLHPDLHVAVKAAKALQYKSITIDTNGYLFHDILNKIKAEDIDFLSFSLDGATKGTNDAIRGEGCYDAVLKGIKKANSKSFATSMIYTVSHKNIHEIKLMPDLVKRLGISRFFIQVIGLRGKLSQKGERLQVSKETWQSVIPEVAKEIAASGI
ncbi:MAG: radical SAM protein, partial [Desulfobacteraceae bacterium]|nr:radical SAM protein [Desulfobacteraceae bacterium]